MVTSFSVLTLRDAVSDLQAISNSISHSASPPPFCSGPYSREISGRGGRFSCFPAARPNKVATKLFRRLVTLGMTFGWQSGEVGIEGRFPDSSPALVGGVSSGAGTVVTGGVFMFPKDCGLLVNTASEYGNPEESEGDKG